ncbi:unnamed protein product [Camellia sinensis]
MVFGDSLATKFRNSGQTCVCANRIIVQEGIYDKFADAFSNIVQKMQVGDGFHEGGPLINEAAVQKVESFLQDAKLKGAKMLISSPLTLTWQAGCWEGGRLAEEVFGPVAPLLRFKTEEEAINIANDTNAGVNEGLVSTEVAPFGGFKQSGLGREGSKYGMDEYLEIKYVLLR